MRSPSTTTSGCDDQRPSGSCNHGAKRSEFLYNSFLEIREDLCICGWYIDGIQASKSVQKKARARISKTLARISNDRKEAARILTTEVYGRAAMELLEETEDGVESACNYCMMALQWTQDSEIPKLSAAMGFLSEEGLIRHVAKTIPCDCLKPKLKQVRQQIAKKGMCASCLKVGLISNQFQCSACGVAPYCSTECQRLHWSVHKRSCCLLAKGKVIGERQDDKPDITSGFQNTKEDITEWEGDVFYCCMEAA